MVKPKASSNSRRWGTAAHLAGHERCAKGAPPAREGDGPDRSNCGLFWCLQSVFAEGSTKGAPPYTADKLRKVLVFLDNVEDPDELNALTAWKAHTLTGDRKGTWSLSVTRNRRLKFRIDAAEHELCEVNLKDALTQRAKMLWL